VTDVRNVVAPRLLQSFRCRNILRNDDGARFLFACFLRSRYDEQQLAFADFHRHLTGFARLTRLFAERLRRLEHIRNLQFIAGTKQLTGCLIVVDHIIVRFQSDHAFV